jgi:hypothetical protein
LISAGLFFIFVQGNELLISKSKDRGILSTRPPNHAALRLDFVSAGGEAGREGGGFVNELGLHKADFWQPVKKKETGAKAQPSFRQVLECGSPLPL